jgi:hypothetical protein
MIAAGVEAFCLWESDDPTEWKVADIFAEMERARRGLTESRTTAGMSNACVEKRRIGGTLENGRP